MSEYLKYVNKTDFSNIGDIIHFIAFKYIEFERIHPFMDGNGRTGRMILNQQLINNKLLPITIEPSAKYRSTFKEYNKTGDATLMENIICKSEKKSIEKMDTLETVKEKSLKIQTRI